jgi:hypothetical protein
MYLLKITHCSVSNLKSIFFSNSLLIAVNRREGQRNLTIPKNKKTKQNSTFGACVYFFRLLKTESSIWFDEEEKVINDYTGFI